MGGAVTTYNRELSIIIPTFNRKERLLRLLHALERAMSEGVEFEAVVVVDGATDGTEASLDALRASYPLQVHSQQNRGPAAARNQGIAAARGRIVLFLDDDVVPVPGTIARHAARHREDPLAVVTGPMIAPVHKRMAPWLEWEAAMLQKQYAAMQAGLYAPTSRQFYTANASIAREHVERVGGFDERYRRAEDVELATRLRDLGLRFHFDAEASVWHEPDRSYSGWLRVAYEYGRYDVISGSRTPDALRLACSEWKTRHRLSRMLAHACAGHAVRTRMATDAGRASFAVAKPLLPLIPRRVQHAGCSALFNLHYWHGVASESGLGPRIWRFLDRPQRIAGAGGSTTSP